jgi:RNA polymerase sigma factor (sigma-70 family)
MIEDRGLLESSPPKPAFGSLCSNLSHGIHAAAQPLTILLASLNKAHTDRMNTEELRELTASSSEEVQRVCTLFVSGDDADSFDLIESAPSAGRDNPLELCLEVEIKAQLAAVISRMSERDQRILSLYYYEEITMKEVSEVVGIGVSRVSQIRAGAILKLRASLAHLRDLRQNP